MFFKNKSESNENNNSISNEDENLEVVIHFTPVSIFIYISEEGFYNDGNTVEAKLPSGSNVKITGNFVHLETSRKTIKEDLSKFKLEFMSLPQTTITLE